MLERCHHLGEKQKFEVDRELLPSRRGWWLMRKRRGRVCGRVQSVESSRKSHVEELNLREARLHATLRRARKSEGEAQKPCRYQTPLCLPPSLSASSSIRTQAPQAHLASPHHHLLSHQRELATTFFASLRSHPGHLNTLHLSGLVAPSLRFGPSTSHPDLHRLPDRQSSVLEQGQP